MRWFIINIDSKTIGKISDKKLVNVLNSNLNGDLISNVKLDNKFEVSVNKVIYNSYQEYLSNYNI